MDSGKGEKKNETIGTSNRQNHTRLKTRHVLKKDQGGPIKTEGDESNGSRGEMICSYGGSRRGSRQTRNLRRGNGDIVNGIRLDGGQGGGEQLCAKGSRFEVFSFAVQRHS